MGISDYILLMLIAIWVIGAIRHIRKSGAGCTGCSKQCQMCNKANCKEHQSKIA